MTKKNKILVIRLIIALIFWIVAIILEHAIATDELLFLSFYIISYLIAGYDILLLGFKNIFSARFLDEYFLMSVASLGAFFIRFFGNNEYLEAVAVMIFFQVGEVFQGVAVEKSKKAIMSTLNLKVTNCTLEDGSVVLPNDVKIGDIIIVKPGEMVPIDGVALNPSIINMASLTGEALDVEISINDNVLSGSINKNTPLKIKVSKEYSDSTVTKILEMVENATMRKAKTEKFITKFARIYTPIVVGLAVLLAVLPPLIIGLINGFSKELWNSYIYAALTCLVVSCPCALVVSVPLSYFAGIGANAKKKIIVKGGITIDDLANVSTIVLDKTGTLTKAEFSITKVYGDEEEILKIARGLEKNSTHPLALAINKSEGEAYTFLVTETPGYGIVGTKDNDKYICGSYSLLKKNNIEPIEVTHAGSILYIAKNDKCIGAIVLEDTIKDEAKEVIELLHKMNKKVIVLSGDVKESVESVCNRLNIKEYHYSLLPQDKVKIVEDLTNNNKNEKILFVGDGINDAPVLALADVGVSMGQIGSDAAVEASDVVILNDNLNALPNMIKIAKKTKRIVIENIIFTIGVKIIILLLCAISNISIFGNFYLPMWVAIFGDVGVCVLAVFNALRALKCK